MRRECRERFLQHCVLAIPAYSTARAWRTRRYACRNRYLAVSFEVGGWENIPGACAIRNFTYLVIDTCPNGLGHDLMSYKLVTSPASNHYSNPISTHCQFNTKTVFFENLVKMHNCFRKKSYLNMASTKCVLHSPGLCPLKSMRLSIPSCGIEI